MKSTTVECQLNMSVLRNIKIMKEKKIRNYASCCRYWTYLLGGQEEVEKARLKG